MITSLHAFCLATAFEQDENGRMMYVGVVSGPIEFGTQPGLLGVHACFQVALDGEGAGVEIEVVTGGKPWNTVATVPSGQKAMSFALPISLMVRDSGELRVRMREAGRPNWLFDALWPLVVDRSAPFLTPAERKRFQDFQRDFPSAVGRA